MASRRALSFLLALLPLLGAAAWLLLSEGAARLLLEGAHAEGVRGRLVGPLRAARVHIELPQQSIELRDVLLDWQPAALLHGELRVTNLAAARLLLTMRIAADQQPARLPASLALPLALRIDALTLEGGEVRYGPLPATQLARLRAQGGFDGRQWRLQLEHFGADAKEGERRFAAQLGGHLRLDAAAPFALAGELHATARETIGVLVREAQGDVRLSGSLARIGTDLVLAAGSARMDGSLALAPFDARPLAAADLRLHELDLSALLPGAPRTRLSGSIAGKENLRISLRNEAASSVERGGLPLRSLSATLEADGTLASLQAALGSKDAAGGEVRGSGRLAGTPLTLNLEASGIDLHALDARLPRTRLGGPLSLTRTQQLALALELREPGGANGLAARATVDDQRVAVQEARLRLGSALAEFSGEVALAGAQEFAASGRIEHLRLQELVRSAALPALLLNGRFRLQGQRLPQMGGSLEFDIADSSLAGQPLAGQGRMRLLDGRLEVEAFTLAAGPNRLEAHGRLQDAGGQLDFRLDAPELARLGSGFGGTLQASGQAQGSLARPTLALEWQTQRLQLPGLRLERGDGNARLQLDKTKDDQWRVVQLALQASLQGYAGARAALANVRLRFAGGEAADAPFALSLQAERLSAGAARLEQLSVEGKGSSARHTIDAVLDDRAHGQRWTLGAEGALSARRWQGRLLRLDGEGSLPLALSAPADLRIGDGFALQDLRIASGRTRLALDSLVRDADGLAVRGSVQELEPAALLRLAGRAPPISSDLRLNGAWDLRHDGQRWRGNAQLARSAGDLTVHGDADVVLQLTQLAASIEAGADGLRLHAEATGARLGTIQLDARAADADMDAALSGQASLHLPALDWLGPLLGAGTITDGKLDGSVQLGGTLGTPDLSGTLEGRGLRFALGDAGVDLRNGELAARFRANTLELTRLRFGHGGGTLEGEGALSYADGQPQLRLAARAQSYPLLQRSDRRLTLSGTAALAWLGGRPSVSGSLVADHAFVDVGRDGTPELGDDVVVLGAKPRAAASSGMTLDLALDLGSDAVVRGRGLDVRLGGQLRLADDRAAGWRAQGSVSVVEGSYAAYGRKLAIEHGVLRFNGALGNPALDITAMRRGQEVEAGVAVRGTVLAPRVTLVSEPTVPDAEKLSWLVLGHALDNAAGGDVSALQAAASALLSEGAAAGVQSQIATTFGLDDFRIANANTPGTQDNLQQRIVTVGKRLNARLYVSFQQALQSTGSVLLLRYTLSPRLTVEAEAGTRSAISLLYNLSFD